MAQQLTLSIALPVHSRFSTYHVSDDNRVSIDYLTAVLAGDEAPFCYLWGNTGSGRTHLLQASCHTFGEQHNKPVLYLPLHDHPQFSSRMLEEADSLGLVCLDDIDAIVGLPDWEEALFHLYNRLQAANIPLLMTANTAPHRLSMQLPDLASRLQAGVSFQLRDLNDDDKLIALQCHADQRGFELPDDVGRYLLHRCDRNMAALCEILNTLDKASLQAQRRLTIPFIKQLGIL